MEQRLQKKSCRYLLPFEHNARTWQTDKQTDRARNGKWIPISEIAFSDVAQASGVLSLLIPLYTLCRLFFLRVVSCDFCCLLKVTLADLCVVNFYRFPSLLLSVALHCSSRVALFDRREIALCFVLASYARTEPTRPSLYTWLMYERCMMRAVELGVYINIATIRYSL